MASFEPGDVIKVPFPHKDRPTGQSRPALVVFAPALEEDHGLLWVVMITSAENRGWPGDVAVRELDMAVLPVASVVRTAKIGHLRKRRRAAPGARLGKPDGAGQATPGRDAGCGLTGRVGFSSFKTPAPFSVSE